MIIEKVQIYGFGKWTNTTFDMNSSLTVISGPNESGKTSLKQFIIYVLFDLPSSQRKKYEPKEGSRLGGRLFIQDAEKGRIIIERVADKDRGKSTCQMENGEEHGEAFLQQLLKGMDRYTFQNIFAFDDQELQKLRFLNGDELGKVLFGVGLSGSDKIANLEDKLTKDMDILFKKKGKKPIINEQLNELKQLSDKISQLETQQNQYNELLEKKQQILKKIAATNEDIQKNGTDLRTLHKYLQAKDAIQEYQLMEAQLEDYKDIDSFPESGLERHQKLKESLLPIESDRNAINKKLEKEKEKLQELQEQLLDDNLFHQIEKVDKLYKDVELMGHQIGEKKKEIDRLQFSYQTESEKIGIHRQQLTLSDYALTIYVEEKWKELGKRYKELATEEENIYSEEKRLLREIEEMKNELSHEKRSLLQQEEYEVIHSQLEEYKKWQWAKDVAEKQQFHHKEKQDRMEKSLKNIGRATLVIAFLLSLGMTVFGFLSEGVLGYIVAGIVLILGLTVALATKRFSSTLYSDEKHWMDSPSNSKSLTNEDVESLNRKLREHENVEQRLEDRKKQLEENERSLEFCKEKRKEVQHKKAQIDTQIKMEQATYPFLSLAELEFWPALFQKITSLQKLEGNIQEIETHINQIQQNKEKQQELGLKWLSSCQMEDVNKEDVWDKLLELKGQEEKRRQEIGRIQMELANMGDELEQLRDKQEPYLEELVALRKIANTENEEEFLKKGNRHQEKIRFMNKQREILHTIQFIFDSQYDERVLEEIQWDEIDRKKDKLSLNVEEQHHNVERYRQDLADCKAEINQLEENEQLSELRHQFSFMKNELRDHVKQWMTLKAAHNYIRRTKEVYQNDYLPEIVDKASMYFEKLTNGKYIKIILPIRDELIQVESKEHILYDVTQLSTGATAQAYVALRLALSELMNSSYGVPFLIDDAFVHFDGIRKHIMITILEEICQKQQVIYFTCFDSKFPSQTNIDKVLLENSAIFTS